MIREMVPDKKKALSYVEKFEIGKWEEFLKDFLGKSGEALIELEKKEGKYDKQKHAARLDVIVNHWQEILDIISQELPRTSDIIDLLKLINAPIKPEDIGISQGEVKNSFIATKDIRDKYIASRLLWDIGMIEKVAEKLITNKP